MNDLAEFNWYSNESSTFGDRLAAARESLGLSQSDLAKKLGVSADSVEGWENDVREPRANRLQMLSGVLNVSIPWLLIGEGDGLAAPGADEPQADLDDLMSEFRLLRSQMTKAADRMGVLEKRLKSAMTDHAA
ncbi:MAG: helix-turn-helix domain-containing protein [Boseongicola sp.]|nr:MAG: helix-turn-helix domain-containing protein [Boseongicola sp.]